MRNEDSDFSSLKTVSSFDKGDPYTVAIDIASKDLQNFSPSSLLVESLIEQLCKLMEKDPQSQKKLYLTVCEKLNQMNLVGESYQRDEFQFMRTHYQKALYQLLTIAKTTSTESRKLCSSKIKSTFPSSKIVDFSRYSTEFRELDYIAHGGFGKVYKAENKLDGVIYAVKKIGLKCHNVNDFLSNLSEVKMLAKLNHPNIVAYKAAWLEPMGHKKIETEENTEDSLEIVFESSDNKEINQTTISQNAVCKYTETTDYAGLDFATLYIQMQLCKATLRQWLDNRNQNMENLNFEKSSEIFRQVVRGIEYIHSQGIVHHDIKPSNVFVSEDLREVQVGDFGLACCLLAHQPSSLSVITHKGQVGTKLYAAPEQLQGTCDPKSDLYSLGIILFELIQPFNTAMERSKMITQLRSGNIPTELIANYPGMAKIISKTVTSLKNRPSAYELLNSLDVPENTSTMMLLASQKETIETLRKESIEKDEEIASLKQQLEELKKNVKNEK